MGGSESKPSTPLTLSDFYDGDDVCTTYYWAKPTDSKLLCANPTQYHSLNLVENDTLQYDKEHEKFYIKDGFKRNNYSDVVSGNEFEIDLEKGKKVFKQKLCKSIIQTFVDGDDLIPAQYRCLSDEDLQFIVDRKSNNGNNHLSIENFQNPSSTSLFKLFVVLFLLWCFFKKR